MSVTTEIQRLQDAKAAIKESIIGKNVEVPDDATLDEYSGLVDQIKTGKEITVDNIYDTFSPVKKQIFNIGDETYMYQGLMRGHCWADKLNKTNPIDTNKFRWDDVEFGFDTSISTSSKDLFKSVDNIYLFPSSSIGGVALYRLNKETLKWEAFSSSVPTSFGINYVWNDGVNTYYSHGSTQRILNEETNTWETKTWTGLTSFYGEDIWSDGVNTYYSHGSTQRILNEETNTWETKTWTGLTSFYGEDIWSDGENVYYSSSSTQYVLDKETSTWTKKTWTGLTSFYGGNIWSDGENVYYSSSSTQYVLDKATLSFKDVTHYHHSSAIQYGYIVDGDDVFGIEQTNLSYSPK